jgi:hypothetical protein
VIQVELQSVLVLDDEGKTLPHDDRWRHRAQAGGERIG